MDNALKVKREKANYRRPFDFLVFNFAGSFGLFPSIVNFPVPTKKILRKNSFLHPKIT